MEKKFDSVENYLSEAFRAFEKKELAKAEKMLNAAFRELVKLGSKAGVDLSGFEVLWNAI